MWHRRGIEPTQPEHTNRWLTNKLRLRWELVRSWGNLNSLSWETKSWADHSRPSFLLIGCLHFKLKCSLKWSWDLVDIKIEKLLVISASEERVSRDSMQNSVTYTSIPVLLSKLVRVGRICSHAKMWNPEWTVCVVEHSIVKSTNYWWNYKWWCWPLE